MDREQSLNYQISAEMFEQARMLRLMKESLECLAMAENFERAGSRFFWKARNQERLEEAVG